jgi:hypothetical protein
MSQPPRPGQPNPHVGCSGTLLEAKEDIRQALESEGHQLQSPLPYAIRRAISVPHCRIE